MLLYLHNNNKIFANQLNRQNNSYCFLHDIKNKKRFDDITLNVKHAYL